MASTVQALYRARVLSTPISQANASGAALGFGPWPRPFKSETYRFLRLARPTEEEQASGAVFPPGTLHLPAWVEDEWLKQLVAEQLVTVKTKRGFSKLEWQKLRERNEALDLRVYARAATWVAGADRWAEQHWQSLEAELGVSGATVLSPPKAKLAQTDRGNASRNKWIARRRGSWL